MTHLLNDVISQYMSYRRAAYRANTVRSADTSMRQFLAVVGNIQTKNLTPRHAERFQSTMLQKGMKPSTVNARMCQVSAFSKWAVANRYLPVHFVGTVRTIPVPKRPRLRVPATDFMRLLDGADRPDQRITVALGLFLFLRGGEIRTLKIGDVDLDLGTVAVTVHKTNDWDEMPICQELDEELRRWFKAYAADIGRPLDNADYLVPAHKKFPGWNGPSEEGNYIPDRQVLRPFRHAKALLAKAGYPITDKDGKENGEGVHTLRRSGARALYEALVEGRIGDPAARDDALRQVMTALHHKSVAVTEGYIGLERDRQRRDQTMRGVRMLPQLAANVTPIVRREA